MAHGLDRLGPTAGCPRADRCQACGGGQDLEVATYQTPVGVFCATVCGQCADTGLAPPVRSWVHACLLVGEHCEHLGIDLDQMADVLKAEREER